MRRLNSAHSKRQVYENECFDVLVKEFGDEINIEIASLIFQIIRNRYKIKIFQVETFHSKDIEKKMPKKTKLFSKK